ncbi:hypothetical protein C4B68_11540 [Streptomyces dengpaensis]|uniref:Uncharacterized protein n=1 Tax=Streptomyces dengpaensis TaxID=2049881 RepID=A0ABM6SNV2_9ACTN|nr:hypothetical protein C4B68_11540 [Streptomyces dengpaensis]PIB07268.1 hypothetical protein B1C81_21410 [Streptomyces sp. HG99]
MCGRRSARRRGEVAPCRRLGTVLASPHSTNNLSASAPSLCRGMSPAPLTNGQFSAFQHVRRRRSKQSEPTIPSAVSA